MATTKKKPNREKKPNKSDDDFFEKDYGTVPVIGLVRNAVEITHPKIFGIINSLKLNQSGTFPTEKYNIISAIRLRIFKLHNKKFVIKKINPTQSRIWRVADSVETVFGRKVERKNPNHGGKRIKGQHGPKQNKNGQSIVPVLVDSNEFITKPS